MVNVIDPKGTSCGNFDGEYLYNLEGKTIYRVDGDEVYTTDIPCKYIGSFDGSKFLEANGKLAFTITT